MPAEFKNKALKLTLTLRFSGDELRQGDVERFMGAFNRLELGRSAPEHNGKVIRAAVAAGWVQAPVWTVTRETDDIALLKPSHAAWYAAQIDSVYDQAMNVPKA